MQFEDIKRYVLENDVPGWLASKEGQVLYELAKAAGESSAPYVVELGTYCARATCYLAAGFEAAGNGQVISIDHHDPAKRIGWNPETTVQDSLAKANEVLAGAGLSAWADLWVGELQEMAGDLPERAHAVFIDGNHDHDSVLADLGVLGKLVPRGTGVIALHDWGQPGPKDAPWGVEAAWADYLPLVAPRKFEAIEPVVFQLACFHRTY